VEREARAEIIRGLYDSFTKNPSSLPHVSKMRLDEEENLHCCFGKTSVLLSLLYASQKWEKTLKLIKGEK
jgi:hypothetical protein